MNDQIGQTTTATQETDLGKVSVLPLLPIIRQAEGKGQGVFSSRPLAKGEVAIVGKPVSVSPERTTRTLQMDVDTHVLMDVPFELANHSCDPNCGIRVNSHNGYNMIALMDIATGEELTWDYCMTEWICIGPKNCYCGSDQCRKVIRGAKFLTLEELKKYDGYTAPYFETLLQDLLP